MGCRNTRGISDTIRMSHHLRCKHQIKYEPKSNSILNYYSFGGVIGMGTFGKVRSGRSLLSGQQVAIKSIDKKKFHEEKQLLSFQKELDILFSLDHPNIIKFIESFESSRYLHIVTELCEGGDLCQLILKTGGLSEQEAGRLFNQVLLAVHNLHINGVCHRDIKAENFIFVSKDPNSDLKLIDFGLSSKFSKSYHKMVTYVGSSNYLAPEISKKTSYDYKCDMWSLGVLLYVLLSGYFPSEEHLFREKAWSSVSDLAKDMIRHLLVEDPEQRFDTSAAFEHPWMSSKNKSMSKINIDGSIMKSLKHFHPKTVLQREVLQLIAKFYNSQEVKDINQAFLELDADHTGYLTIQQIEKALGEVNEEVKEALLELDYNDDGKIQYTDFLVATISSKVDINDEVIHGAFAYFDVDKTGFITAENLVEAFTSMGFATDYQEILQLIKEVDIEEHDGKISYQEFKNAVLGNINYR